MNHQKVNPNRQTFQMTDITRRRLDQECERLKSLEGATVAPARIINDLIMAHLAACPGEPKQQISSPPGKRKKKPLLARSA